MSSRKGYSLLEIVICMILLSIISNVVMFSTINIEKTSLKNDGLILKNNITEMQSLAIFTDQESGVCFDSDITYYTYTHKNNKKIIIEKYFFTKENFVLESNAYNGSINYTNRGTITRACSVYLASDNFKIKLTCDVGSGNLNLYGVESR